MTFMKRFIIPAVAVVLLVAALVSCEKDPTTIGAGVVGGEPFDTGSAIYDVFAYNKKIEAVRTNKLPVYQLGTFDHPVYGKTEASVTSQILLPNGNPTFGAYSQAVEDNPSSSVPQQIVENETVDSVYLYIPFLTNPMDDSDADGVSNDLDADPDDPNSNSDSDTLTDSQEKSRGTDPLNDDTDGDGISDDVDEDFVQNQYKKNFDLDSIYVNGEIFDRGKEASIHLKVERSNFFLRDLDPNANFQETQSYFSNQQFSPTFVDEVVFDGIVPISHEQIPLKRRDDPATEDEDESTQNTYLDPGIRVALDVDFFQQHILDMEGSPELATQANFNEFLRGLHFSLVSDTDEIMFLFDLKAANITVSYSYDSADTSGAVTEQGQSRDFRLSFLQALTNSQGQATGAIRNNAVNTIINETFPTEISENLDTGENASRIYLKGGPGAYAEIKLFDEVNGKAAINQIKANNWIVNEANLVFYVDKEAGVIEPPRLYLFNSETYLPLVGANDSFSASSSLGSYPFYDGILVEDGSSFKYTVKITDYINDMVIRNNENVTLGLTITSDLRQFGVSNAILQDNEEKRLPVYATVSPLGTVLYGSNVDAANADKKLKLEIFYTETN